VRIDEIIATKGEPTFSFEFFPPRTEEGERNLRETLTALRELKPDFVSVTYGAGGSTRERTVGLTKWIKQGLEIEAMAHLSCVGATREELYEVLDGLAPAGIDNVLALRGDPPRGETDWKPHPGGLHYSTELAALISDRYEFCVGAACFPEIHPEAPDLAHDLRFLREKVEAGATFAITQMFFDNELYFRFVDEARAAGIEIPIIAGIMPITDFAQIKTITGMCGASIPQRLMEALEWRAHDSDAVLQLGVAYATLQCAELLARGAPGIQFFTLNRSPATRAILSSLRLLRPWAGRLSEPVGTSGAAD
jgi:methylenetetrahydrofolate reductase (NADPH)